MCCCDEHRCEDSGKHSKEPLMGTLREHQFTTSILEQIAGITPTENQSSDNTDATSSTA